MTTGDICGNFKKLDRCTVMQHLGVLEKAGLVISQRKGRFKWNYLNAVPIRSIYDRWINQYTNHSVDILSRLSRDMNQ